MPFFPPSGGGGLTPEEAQDLIDASLIPYSTTAQMGTAITAAVPANVLDTQGSDSPDFALTNLAPNGNVDGVYTFFGRIVTSAGGVLSLRPNNATTNQLSATMFNNAGAGTVAGERRTDLIIGGIVSAGAISFRAMLAPKTGRIRLFFCQSYSAETTASNNLEEVPVGLWTETATNITGFTLHFDSGNIVTGSYVVSTKTKNVV